MRTLATLLEDLEYQVVDRLRDLFRARQPSGR